MNHDLEIRMATEAGRWGDVNRLQKRYSEDQPREADGKFGSGGGETPAGGATGSPENQSASKAEVSKMLEAGGVHTDSLGKNKQGNFVARWGFFYKSGTSEDKAEEVKKAIPSATIVGHHEVNKAFSGGASVANSSHFAVEFKVPKGA